MYNSSAGIDQLDSRSLTLWSNFAKLLGALLLGPPLSLVLVLAYQFVQQRATVSWLPLLMMPGLVLACLAVAGISLFLLQHEKAARLAALPGGEYLVDDLPAALAAIALPGQQEALQVADGGDQGAAGRLLFLHGKNLFFPLWAGLYGQRLLVIFLLPVEGEGALQNIKHLFRFLQNSARKSGFQANFRRIQLEHEQVAMLCFSLEAAGDLHGSPLLRKQRAAQVASITGSLLRVATDAKLALNTRCAMPGPMLQRQSAARVTLPQKSQVLRRQP